MRLQATTKQRIPIKQQMLRRNGRSQQQLTLLIIRDILFHILRSLFGCNMLEHDF